MEKLLYQGTVYWSFVHEIEDMGIGERFFVRHVSFSAPLSKHQGVFYLSDRSIILESEDQKVTIPLSKITQLYLGFDEVFSGSSVKNFGMFWQPLRIVYNDDEVIYLIIDYKYGFAANKQIFQLLKEIC
jgi:hypothetical protein